MPEPIRMMRALAAILLVSLALPAHAERYRVDLIVFADKTGAAGESPVPFRAPELARVIDPADTAKLRAAGIELVPEANFALTEEWRRLSNSQAHQPLVRLAWIQRDPPSERGPGLRVRSGGSITSAAGGSVYPIDGAVSLLMGRFLHLNASLAFTQLDSNGELRSYRLDERRRMRRNELHHLDSPRLGVLARVVKAP